MQKIFFVINDLAIGGVQSSLRNLLAEIHNRYDITLLCFDNRALSDAQLPADIKVISVCSPFRYFGCSQAETRNQPIRYIARAFWAILTRIFGRSFVIKLMLPFQRRIGRYDCAISFLHESPQKNFYGGCNEFVLKRVDAQKKVAWLHCDFEQCGANTSNSRHIYQQFDQIVACSEGTKQTFIRCMPQFADKCVSIRNCNEYGKIRQLAGKGVAYDTSVFNIVTVARLDKEKGIERAIHAVHECVNRGYQVHYHIIGGGALEETLKGMVLELGLSKTVTFYGSQSNPYVYMIHADLFILPSYHEAAPMVFDEAACLGVPVLATRTTSTDEMIARSHSGFVCENSDEGIKLGLLELMEHPEKLIEIKKALEIREFSNAAIVEAFDQIISG